MMPTSEQIDACLDEIEAEAGNESDSTMDEPDEDSGASGAPAALPCMAVHGWVAMMETA